MAVTGALRLSAEVGDDKSADISDVVEVKHLTGLRILGDSGGDN